VRTTSGTRVVVVGAHHELRLDAPPPTGTTPWGRKACSMWFWERRDARRAEGGTEGATGRGVVLGCLSALRLRPGRHARVERGGAGDRGFAVVGRAAGRGRMRGWGGAAPKTMCCNAGAGCQPGTHERVGRGGTDDYVLQRWGGTPARDSSEGWKGRRQRPLAAELVRDADRGRMRCRRPRMELGGEGRHRRW
jgi:hypothetical protein